MRLPIEQLVLDVVLAAEPDGVTRAQLSDTLKVAPSTIADAVARLRGAVATVDSEAPRHGKTGPTPQVLRVPQNAGVVLGLEIAQDHLLAAAYDARGEPHSEPALRGTRGSANPVDVRRSGESIEWLANACRQLTGGQDPKKVIGVGIAVSAPVNGVDPQSGQLVADLIMPDWVGVGPATDLKELLGWACPFLVDNDATLACLAEHRWGAAIGKDNVLYLQWAYGIGGGLIVDGHVALGSSRTAGEVGHCAVVLTREDREVRQQPRDGDVIHRCPRCHRYCLESVAGLGAVIRRSGLPDETSAGELFEAAESGDSAAKDAIAVAARYIGQALGTYLNLLNPEAVIIGGEVPPRAEELFRADMRVAMKEYSLRSAFSGTELRVADLGGDASVRGAVALVLDERLRGYLLSAAGLPAD